MISGEKKMTFIARGGERREDKNTILLRLVAAYLRRRGRLTAASLHRRAAPKIRPAHARLAKASTPAAMAAAAVAAAGRNQTGRQRILKTTLLFSSMNRDASATKVSRCSG